MENLKWYIVPGFEKYEINEQLQVRHRLKKKIKSCYMHEGYLRLNLHFNNGEKCNRYLHQVVGWTFVPNPENKPELHHIDEDKLNNAPSNLMWVTRAEHRRISVENEQINFKISRVDVVLIRDSYSESNEAELAKKYGVSKNTIYLIAIGNNRSDIKEGKIHPPRGLFKKVKNIETGEIYESVEYLAKIKDINCRKLRRVISGERYNKTPYRYVGQENVVKVQPEAPKSPIAVFNPNWEYVTQFDYPKDLAVFLKASDCSGVYEFLKGRISQHRGYKFKRISENGDYVEPIPFVSKKPPLKPKKIKQPVTPSKGIIKYSLDGAELERFESLGSAAKSIKADKSNFRFQVKRSPTGFHKGFIWKYA